MHVNFDSSVNAAAGSECLRKFNIAEVLLAPW